MRYEQVWDLVVRASLKTRANKEKIIQTTNSNEQEQVGRVQHFEELKWMN
jgi:hypothetical protein